MKDFDFDLTSSEDFTICREGEDEPLVVFEGITKTCVFSDECSLADLQRMIGILLNYINEQAFCFPSDPTLLPLFKN